MNLSDGQIIDVWWCCWDEFTSESFTVEDLDMDCNGECGGDAVVDCAEECGGDAVVDYCDECGGSNDCLGLAGMDSFSTQITSSGGNGINVADQVSVNCLEEVYIYIESIDDYGTKQNIEYQINKLTNEFLVSSGIIQNSPVKIGKTSFGLKYEEVIVMYAIEDVSAFADILLDVKGQVSKYYKSLQSLKNI